MRPSRNQLMMEFARIVSTRGTCDRLHVGAVVASPDGRHIMGYGYNGNAATLPDECDNPETPGRCGCVHAEANALVNAERTRGMELFVTHSPCIACAKLIVNAGIAFVYFLQYYRDDEGLELLRAAGIPVMRQNPMSGL